jgi:hypothetical protein
LDLAVDTQPKAKIDAAAIIINATIINLFLNMFFSFTCHNKIEDVTSGELVSYATGTGPFQVAVDVQTPAATAGRRSFTHQVSCLG